MNLLNVCLKIPNLGLITFHIIFVIILPYLFLTFKQNDTLKFYWPVLIAIATIFTEVGKPFIFQNLYEYVPKTLISFISSNIINLVAIMGIIWQSVTYHTATQHLEKTLIIGMILFLITFPLARSGTTFVIRKWDDLVKNTNMSTKYNQHKFIIGFVYLVFLVSIQMVLLNFTNSLNITPVLSSTPLSIQSQGMA